MKVSQAVGQTIARMGPHVFGVVGSGNFRATNALKPPARWPTPQFTATRHEMGAACMADAYARASGKLAVVTVHQGCGLSNALTGIGEAVKAHTPLLVISGDTRGEYGSNFWIDQDAVIEGMGAIAERLHSPARAVTDTIRAITRAKMNRVPVVLSMPLDIQESELSKDQEQLLTNIAPPQLPAPAVASADAVASVSRMLTDAQRPVILAGRGGAQAVAPLRQVAELSGALLTTSAVGRGLFNEDPWHMDAMGGFATDGAAELVHEADLLVVFGAALNRWTTRDGTLLQNKTVIQIDDDATAFGKHYPVSATILGDAALTAQAIRDKLAESLDGTPRTGYRTTQVKERLAASLHWRDQAYEDNSEPAGKSHRGKSTRAR